MVTKQKIYIIAFIVLFIFFVFYMRARKKANDSNIDYMNAGNPDAAQANPGLEKPVTSPDEKTELAITSPYTKGDVIKSLQNTLNFNESSGLNPDGVYGPRTKAAHEKAVKKYGLSSYSFDALATSYKKQGKQTKSASETKQQAFIPYKPFEAWPSWI